MNLYNPYIVIPFVVWIIAQLAKLTLAAMRQKHLDLRYLYASGGMPSAHSAVVCALAVTALLHAGITSPIFGLSVVFAAIVMYDSFGVRRAAGEQAAAINSILDLLAKQRSSALGEGRLREILGHKPLEVTAGALLGVVLGLVFGANYLTVQLTWLRSFPGKTEAIVYMSVSLLVILLTVGTVLWLRRRYRDSKIMASFRKQILILGLTVGVVGVILGFAGYEQALYLGWRVWIYLLLAILIVWKVAILGIYWNRLPEALHQEAEAKRIRRWLPGKKRRRRG